MPVSYTHLDVYKRQPRHVSNCMGGEHIRYFGAAGAKAKTNPMGDWQEDTSYS